MDGVIRERRRLLRLSTSSSESEGDDNANPIHGDMYHDLLKDVHEQEEREKEEVEAKHREMTEACASLKDIIKKENEETRAVVETKTEEVKEKVDEVKQEVKAGVDILGSQMESLQKDVKDVKFLLESAQKIAAANAATEAVKYRSLEEEDLKRELFVPESITLDDSSGASLATQSEKDEEIARLREENKLLRKKSEEERSSEEQHILNDKKRSEAEEDAAVGSTRPIKKLKSKIASFTDRLPLMGGNPK